MPYGLCMIPDKPQVVDRAARQLTKPTCTEGRAHSSSAQEQAGIMVGISS